MEYSKKNRTFAQNFEIYNDMITLKNECISISVKKHGAELASLKKGEREYLWQADPEFWARHSPVLFPIVGNLYDKKFRMRGEEFTMGQHGFARDCDFVVESLSDDEVWMVLKSDEDSFKKFPADFILRIGYRLEGSKVHVMWRVANPSPSVDLAFQIGAHPAFYWPEHNSAEEPRGYFAFDGDAALVSRKLIGKGCVSPVETFKVELDELRMLKLNADTFDQIDTIILENQVHQISLCDLQRNPVLVVRFETAPVVGLWSPPGRRAPFVCIEPWFGRCDFYGYEGEFKDKEWINILKPGENFDSDYTIEIA